MTLKLEIVNPGVIAKIVEDEVEMLVIPRLRFRNLWPSVR